MKSKIFIIISFILALSVVTLNCFYNNTDISLYPIKNFSTDYQDQKIWLISYGSNDVYLQNQNNLVVSATIYQIFDFIISYTPANIDEKYYKLHKNILDQRRGAGYWLWKPYFILKTLEIMPENDVLVYVDSSGVFRKEIQNLIELAKVNNIVVFPNFHSNRGYIKKIVVDTLADGDMSILDKPQLDGSIMLFRNNEETREIIAKWLENCEDEKLLTDSRIGDEYSDFKDHRHDQAILSVMYNLSPEKFYLYEEYPARLKSVIVTRRKNACSMIPVTFSEETSFNIWDDIKYRSLYFLLGCQRFKGS